MLQALLPFTLHESSFSRSYGGILPSSLNEGFPAHLRILSPPTCVGFGTGDVSLPRSFSLDSVGSITSLLSLVTRHHISAFRATDLPIAQPTCLNTHFQSRADLPYCVTHRSNDSHRYRNFNLLSIAYAFPPRLRSRLYPETTIVAQEPLGFRWNGFSPFFSLLIPTFSLLISPQLLTVLLQPDENAPLPIYIAAYDTTSVLHFSPGHLRRRVSRPVSYYALFKWWLLLSQHPGCFGNSTSFAT